jgi:signal transduction histidine kinase
MSSGNLDQATMHRALEIIERNTRLQAQLIEDLLDVSRIISGKLRLDLRPAAMSSVVEAAIESVRPTADAKHITIRFTSTAISCSSITAACSRWSGTCCRTR